MFGLVLAFFSRPGVTYDLSGRAVLPLPPPGELAARGTLRTSIAANAVMAPRPPLPQSALDRDSPPRLPVPHKALDRISPRLPLFILTFRVSFPRPRAVRRSVVPQLEAWPPLRDPGAT